ncbi:MAG: DUF1538 domain-containing protein [Treponema sp.]|jgi:hypothetical protein|nr:DUF1538 domain-containing protein [Treponema sp.]
MNKVLQEKIQEAFTSVLPITAIVLIASIVLVPMSAGVIVMFLTGAALLIIGMGFFTLGADMAMMPMGEGIGAQLTKTSKLALALGISFVMGIIITVAEPDLQVLAGQLAESLNPWTLVITVGVGVGLFLAIAVMRVLFGIPLMAMLLVFYVITFAIAGYMLTTPDGSFIPIAFDSGGVTTGPMTVPFILAMCVGVASLRGDKGSKDDSFGFVSLCSIGPILSVLILGMIKHINKVDAGEPIDTSAIAAYTDRDVVLRFLEAFPEMLQEVAMALAAILLFFAVFQLISRRYKKQQLMRISVGFIYTFIGLVLFLIGVEVGFIPVGHLFGYELAKTDIKWALVPLSMLIGYFIVAAEPAVHVLNKQVEDVSQGAITQNVMNTALSIGMSLALGITMVRILTGISIIWILVPGYAFALILTFFVPRIFTGIAFDSGGVCSGPMTSTFLLPLALGTCEGVGGDMMKDAFGIVAMVAMTPLVVIQLLGLVYGRKMKAEKALSEAEMLGREKASEIIVFEEDYIYV